MNLLKFNIIIYLFFFLNYVHSQTHKQIAEIDLKIEEIINKNLFYDGPNCWNLALHINGLNHYLRYTSSSEFTSWLKSPLCKKISVPSLGDIIALRNYDDELHGMIYLRNTQVFSKNGYRSTIPYEICDQKDLEDRYLFIWTGYPKVDSYHCKSLSKYLDLTDSPLKRIYIKWNFTIKKLSHRINQAYLNDKLLNHIETSEMILSIDQLKKEIKKNINNHQEKEGCILIMNAFYETLNSLYENIDFVSQ